MRSDQYIDGFDWDLLSSEIDVRFSAFINKNAQDSLMRLLVSCVSFDHDIDTDLFEFST